MTPHGVIKTPAYVIVATHGSVKALKPSDIKKTGTQVVIANTFHLWQEALQSKKLKVTSNKGGNTFLIKKLGTRLPTMTDSGGFQLFSFGAAREHNVGKVLKRGFKPQATSDKEYKVKITEKGVAFLRDGKWSMLTPELSMKIQQKIGADIIFALDECTSPLHSSIHNKKALERTNRWALRCLRTKKSRQLLFGIVQGGRFKNLRTASVKAIGVMPFDGFGIGGSFGEAQMSTSLKAVLPHLPDDKPRHLLGIGKVRDIFTAVENGVDLFDCVIPTREARHGRIYTATGTYDVRKGTYAHSTKPLEKGCGCFACSHTAQGEIRAFFKTKTPQGGRLATIHNVFFFNTLTARIRDAIQNGTFQKLKKKYL